MRPNRVRLSPALIGRVADEAVDRLLDYLGDHWANRGPTVEVDGLRYSTRGLANAGHEGLIESGVLEDIPGLTCDGPLTFQWLTTGKLRQEVALDPAQLLGGAFFEPEWCTIGLRVFLDVSAAELAQNRRRLVAETRDVIAHELTHATDRMVTVERAERDDEAQTSAGRAYFQLPYEVRARAQQWALRARDDLAELRDSGRRADPIEVIAHIVESSIAWDHYRERDKRATLKWIYQWLDDQGAIEPGPETAERLPLPNRRR